VLPLFLFSATVDRVIDGDTVQMDVTLGFHVKLEDLRFRLLGMDAPEKTGATKIAGLVATAELTRLLSLGPVTIQSEGGPPKADSFGRWLVKLDVTLADGNHLDVSTAMIQGGYAVPYP
jgi:endonuclease YncB( thermonuclease family)